MIKLKTYTINDLTLTNEILVSYINCFWIYVFNNIRDTNHLMLICKVQFTNEEMGYRTLGHLRKVNFSDKKLFISYLSQRLSVLSDSYMTLPISNITFSYIVREGLCTDKNQALLQDLSDKGLATHNFNNMKLPISMNPADYGNIEVDNYVQFEGENYHRFIVNNGTRYYRIDVTSNNLINKVTILGDINLSSVDTKTSENEALDIFKREIGKATLYFLEGEIILVKRTLSAMPFGRFRS